MTHAQAVDLIRAEKLIAILRDVPEAQARPLLDALYAGGVRVLEFTFDHDKPDFVANTTRKVEIAKEQYGEALLLGCGTVLTTGEADAALAAGAQVIISPHTDPALIAHAKARGAVCIPGALTASEIMTAWTAGADFVKLFPAGELGLGYIKAVRAPLRHIPMVAVGGVTPENAVEFLKAGVLGFGIGGNLVESAALKVGDYARVTERARAFVRAIGAAGK
jgi:2-dehydro-3-deoxyphosphogluconate aldolase/(4S)-4-hydroxy-2-oxoglutarate aldolase